MAIYLFDKLGNEEKKELHEIISKHGGLVNVIVHPGYHNNFDVGHMAEIAESLKTGRVSFITAEDYSPQELFLNELDKVSDAMVDSAAQKIMQETRPNSLGKVVSWIKNAAPDGRVVVVPTDFKNAKPKAGWKEFTTLLKGLGVKQSHIGGEDLFMKGKHIDEIKGCVGQTHKVLKKAGFNPKLKEEWCHIRR